MKFFPEIDEFSVKHARGQAQLVWAELLTDLETPVTAMLKLMEESEYHLLFESVEGGETRARYSIIALDPDIIWRCVDGKAEIKRGDGEFAPEAEDVFASLRRLVSESQIDIPDALPPMAAGLFGYMGYDMVKLMEKLPDENPDNIGIAQSIYIRPKITVIFDSVKDQAIIITPVWGGGEDAETAYKQAQERISAIVEALNISLKRSIFSKYYAADAVGKLEFNSHTGRDDYHKIVEKAKEYIIAGDIFQVVPSRRLSAKFDLHPFAFYRSLRHLNPSPYLFYVHLKDFSLIGSSPEILVRLQDDTVTIRPLAGTRKRGSNPAEDKALEQDLLADEKELAEHLMLLDLGRNDVGRVAQTGSVQVTERMVVERYSHVMHIVSNVEGRIATDKDAIDALIAGFPAGTVSGAPKIRAMEIIDELEQEKRSFYGGTVGYFSAGGDMDSCIALRTGLIRDGVLYVQAGGGVVADSDAEAEFMETENKAGALIAAAQNAIKFA